MKWKASGDVSDVSPKELLRLKNLVKIKNLSHVSFEVLPKRDHGPKVLF